MLRVALGPVRRRVETSCRLSSSSLLLKHIVVLLTTASRTKFPKEEPCLVLKQKPSLCGKFAFLPTSNHEEAQMLVVMYARGPLAKHLESISYILLYSLCVLLSSNRSALSFYGVFNVFFETAIRGPLTEL